MNTIAAALIAGMLTAGPAYAASEDASDRRSVRSEQKQAERPAEKAPAKKDDIDVCKAQAQGKSGPERGTFMTNCLRRN